MASKVRLRLGAHNLSDPQVANLRQAFAAIQAISDKRGYQYIAGYHGEPDWFCWHHQGNAQTGRRYQLFAPWHRAYLYTMERALRDQQDEAMLPWWDWTLRAPRQDGMPRIYAEPAPNPLLNFHINLETSQGRIDRDTVRDPGAGDELPSQDMVDSILSRRDWLDFCLGLEDLHDGVHGWVSGDMGQVSTAAFDPVFWAHHCMIDRLWWLWQLRHGNGSIPPNLLDVVLAPFNMKVRDVLNVQSLGYDYAAARRRVMVPGP